MSNTRPTETHNEAKPTSDRQQPVQPSPAQHQNRPLLEAEMTITSEVISLLGGETSAA